MTAPLADVLAEAWAQALRETPMDAGTDLVAAWLGVRPLTYRERLDRPRVNTYGEVIPRMTIVRNNIRRLRRVRPRLPE